jgi:hypothetical protein
MCAKTAAEQKRSLMYDMTDLHKNTTIGDECHKICTNGTTIH